MSREPHLFNRSGVSASSADIASIEATARDIPPWLERVRGRGPIHISRDCDVRVLDVFRNIATVLVLSKPFMDYLHIARFGERWLIVNVLYEER
jgi:hypothetical protein